MKVHYLEIVSLDVDAICKAYEATHNVSFGEADALLGGARTCTLPDGSIIGRSGRRLSVGLKFHCSAK